MTRRSLIVARILPGSEKKVAEIFARSDATELPSLAGVRHRSLFVLEDLYAHLIESDGDLRGGVGDLRGHPLFQEVSRALEPYIQPYNPATWRSPTDAFAREIYSFDP
ncbi:MAG TPA: TcmI family type II polyketide cyclase [Candidatus Acidoferrales bacterium]|nr:TcmI family type II polyketide cyclase [Candidatus Acidoferrales bacterium]